MTGEAIPLSADSDRPDRRRDAQRYDIRERGQLAHGYAFFSLV
jgi:hypothetical protein